MDVRIANNRPIEFEYDFGFDTDAIAFISAHETSTGLSMGDLQKSAINQLYKDLKGATTNGTDFHAIAVTNSARIYPLAPSNDSTADANGYKLDLVSNGVLSGSYVNFLAGDITPNGAIGGVGKYFDHNKSANSFAQTDFAFGMYMRSSFQDSNPDMGAANGSSVHLSWIYTRRAADSTLYRINGAVVATTTSTDSAGLWTAQINGTLNKLIQNTTTKASQSLASTGKSVENMVSHARNIGGVITTDSVKEQAMYFIGMDALKSQNEIDDWHELWDRYQTNIITGGRNV